MDQIGEGDLVRVLRVPNGLDGQIPRESVSLLKLCVGHTFAVSHYHRGLLGLDVGEVIGKAAYLETIYLEPGCVERVEVGHSRA